MLTVTHTHAQNNTHLHAMTIEKYIFEPLVFFSYWKIMKAWYKMPLRKAKRFFLGGKGRSGSLQ